MAALGRGAGEGGGIAWPHTYAVKLLTLLSSETTWVYTTTCICMCVCILLLNVNILPPLFQYFFVFKNMHISKLKETRWPGLFSLLRKAAHWAFVTSPLFFLLLLKTSPWVPMLTKFYLDTNMRWGHSQMTLPGYCTLPRKAQSL